MKLNFQKIIIENFLSIGYAEIDLHDRGFTLINGVNNNPKDLALSNGSGKSSIMEAICWVLTGETIRGIKDVVNMFNEGGTAVDIHFTVDNDQYRLIRYKEHSKYKTDLKIFINGEDKSGKGIRASQQLLESYLPDLNISLLGSVVILGQGLPQRFTNNAPSGRKEVLEKLSKSDFMIEDLKKRIQGRKSTLDKQLREFEDKILINETQKKTLINQIEINKAKLESMEDPSIYSDIVEKAKLRVDELTCKINELKDKEEEANNVLLELTNKRASIVSDVKDRQSIALREIDDAISEYRTQDSIIRNEVDHLLDAIRKAKSIKDTCPTCGRRFENVFIPNTKDDELKVEELRLKSIGIKKNIDELVDKHNQIVTAFENELSNTIVDIDKQLQEYKAHKSNYATYINNLQSDRYKEESSINKYEQLKSNYETTMRTIKETIASNEEEVKNVDANIVYNSVGKDETSSRLSIINRFNLMTTRDFRGYLLKNVIKYIDTKAKEYCEDVFGTNELDFILDGNSIDIKYCGKYMESLSGGEKQKIDLIIQFSIRDMLCQFLDFRSNLIALDEIFDALDSVSCDKVVNLVSKKLSDIDSVFIITHHKELGIPADNIITVTKQANGVSNVC